MKIKLFSFLKIMSSLKIEGYNLSESEIKGILKGVERKHHLQAYKVLKNITLAPDVSKSDINELKKKVSEIFKGKNLPRLLTNSEIKQVVDVIPLTPATFKVISEENRRQIVELLTRQLSKKKLVVNNDTIEELRKYILDFFYKSYISPGEAVGTNAAVSIGQPITQSTLNTFHTTGSKNNVDKGVNFIEKLFNLTPSIRKTVVIHFKDKNKTKEEIINIGRSLKGVNVASLVKSSVLMKEIKEEDKEWYENYHNIMGISSDMEEGSFLRLNLNTYKCYKYDVSATDVAKAIEKNSKTSGIKQSLKCVASDSYSGIVDIYASQEYIRRTIDVVNKNVIKNTNLIVGSNEDMTGRFLKTLLVNNLKGMFIKGIQNIKGFAASDPLILTTTFNDIEIDNSRDLEKFSSPPHNLKMQDIDYLWYIRIVKAHVLFTGLGEDKFVNLFESAGMKIIENGFDAENPNFTVLMPENRPIKYFDDDGNIFEKYTKMENGKYYDNQEKKMGKNFGPKKLIEEQLIFIQEKMYRDIMRILKESGNPIFPPVDPLYRYGYYYHATVDDGDVISDLFNNKLIDPRYTYPDDVERIYKIFGIEATRFYLSSKYNSVDNLASVNPMNMELILDFQTASGMPLPVTSSGLAKQGSSTMTSAAFQDSMTYLERGAAFGMTDYIRGISGSIMTGKLCRNGTGIVNLDYDEEYLNDPDSKFEKEERSYLEMNVRNLKGPCARYDPVDPAGGGESKIPNPPRMSRAPVFDEEILDIEAIYDGPKEPDTVDDDFELDIDLGDIPDAPATYEIQDMF